MASTAEKFAALNNGLIEINDIHKNSGGEGEIKIATDSVMSRYMVGAKPLTDGMSGFSFVDGSKAWVRQTDKFWVGEEAAVDYAHGS